ncbi:hypothetical protein PS1_023907 [Malus domestica]
MVALSVKPVFIAGVLTLSLVLAVLLLSAPTSPFYRTALFLNSPISKLDTWSVGRMVEWRPCKWWLQGHLTALPSKTKSNGFIRVDCYGGLNQMRRDVSD